MMIRILLIVLALLYTLSPYDLFPDFAFGWGWLDDLIILWILWRYYNTYIKQPKASREYYRRGQYFEQERDKRFSENREYRAEEDPYKVLNIPAGASDEEIKKAYKELAGKYHPDKVHHLGDEFKEIAEKRFKEIQNAYQELMRK
jgi:DnaJ like chaperone protein